MIYQFDSYLVDKQKRKLFNKGELLSDDEKSINLIELLCKNYPEVVDKQLLIDALWPDQVVTDWSLSKLVSDVRQLLGDTGKDQGYIKTVRGKGFRFNSEVSECSQGLVSANISARNTVHKKRYWLSAFLVLLISVVSLLILNAPNSQTDKIFPLRIAVLPIQSESNEPINEWVKYGIMSLATEQLARYQAIQTLPVATVIGSVNDIETIKDVSPMEEQRYYQSLCLKIGCSHVVAIKYRLEDKTSSVLSYQIYKEHSRSAISEFTQPDVFDAATMLLDYLVSDLIPDERQYLPLQDTFSNDNKANRDYAIGVNELHSGDYKSAVDYLNLAIKRKPKFFWAKAYLSEAYYRSGDLLLATQLIEDLRKSDDSNHFSANQLYFLSHLESNILYVQGKLTDSLNVSKTLLNNSYALSDPMLLGNELLNIGSTYQATGELKQAIHFIEQATAQYHLAKFGVGEGKALFNLANVFLSQSKKERAIEHYQRAREIFIRYDMKGYALMAKHQIATTNISLGKIQSAKAELRLIVESYRSVGDYEGELTAMLDLVDVSLVQKNLAEAINRIELLLPMVDSSEFSYLKEHTRRVATVTYLRANEIELAKKSYALFEGSWVDVRPKFAFVPAHFIQLTGDFDRALKLANQLKLTLAERWTEQHQAVLTQFEESKSRGKIIPIVY